MAQQASAAARLGTGLGWFSMALGAAQCLRPAAVARYAGLPTAPRAVRTMAAVGVRELASGAGVLMRPHKPGWLWARVAGDGMDLALLALASRQRAAGPGQRKQRLSLATAAVAGIAVLDTLAALEQVRLNRGTRRGTRAIDDSGDAIRVRKSVNVNQSPEACYRFWRDFGHFPQFMRHVDEIRMLDATRSHWKVRAPLGRHVEWTAELASDVPSQQLGWRTLPGAEIDHAGVVRFVPAVGDRGTTVEVDLSYRAPLGKAGSRIAKLFGEEPSQQIEDDLRRFKQLIETGEIPTTTGQPTGRRSLVGRALHRGAPG